MSDLLRLVPQQHKLRHEWWASVLRASIAAQITELRLLRKWTQADLARRMGTKSSVVSILENERHTKFPSVRTLCRVAAAFDVALIIRFAGFREAMAFVADAVIPLSFDEEASQIPQHGGMKDG